METPVNLLVIEDSLQICSIIRTVAEEESFDYTAEAHTVDEAQDRIRDLESGVLNTNVILLDGSLSKGRPPGADAALLYPKIRKANPTALVIGISAFELADQCPGIHDLTKSELIRLGGFVRELLNSSD